MFTLIPFFIGLHHKPPEYRLTKCAYCPQAFDRLSKKLAHEDTCGLRAIRERQAERMMEDAGARAALYSLTQMMRKS